jgi:large subunit ribosomal protein L32
MAVPKKRTSKSRKNRRKTEWIKKASLDAKKAISQAKSTLKLLLKDKETEG